MKRLMPAIVVCLAAAASGAMAVTLWLRAETGEPVKLRNPDGDAGAAVALPARRPLESVELVAGAAAPVDLPGAWPRFRGANFDAVSTEPVSLARSWPAGGPPRLWAIDVGDGYAAAAVLGGRVYVLDYDMRREGDALRCLSLADGKEIWRVWYPLVIQSPHGKSRTIPAVTEEFVVTFGPEGHVLCVEARTGKFLWGLDLARDHGATVPDWNAGQCPLIDAGRAILAVGGPDLMIAVDCRTGKVLWRTPNPDGWKMTHSSIMPMTVAGRRMLVYSASGGIVGVAADDGSLLWKTDKWSVKPANSPSPLVLPDGRFFVTGGYGVGSAMFQVAGDGKTFDVRLLYRLKRADYANEQQTPVLYNGYIYGLREKGDLVCLDPESGRVVWVGGQRGTFGKGLGPWMVAGGLLLAMDDEGTLTLVEPDPAGYKHLAQAKVLDGHESWGPMALAGGRLIVRDFQRMVCLDLRAN